MTVNAELMPGDQRWQDFLPGVSLLIFALQQMPAGHLAVMRQWHFPVVDYSILSNFQNFVRTL